MTEALTSGNRVLGRSGPDQCLILCGQEISDRLCVIISSVRNVSELSVCVCARTHGRLCMRNLLMPSSESGIQPAETSPTV